MAPATRPFLPLTLILSLVPAAGAAEGPRADSAPQRVLVAKATAEALDKLVPESLDDLRAIEEQVKKVAQVAVPATVGVRVGSAQGSGVIVSEDGLILTAAHVSGEAGRAVLITLPDGRTVRGRSLGLNAELDAGMMKINDPGPWPHVAVAEPDSLEIGDWCVAIGHPGGYQDGRDAPVRLGRIVAFRSSVVQTDCTLVGGDSGGPLFDMQGRVIGIHSRIGPSTAWNFHVPISVYRDGWDRMLAGKEWGGVGKGALLGVVGEDDERGCRITSAAPGLPAGEAGLQEGDIITHVDGRRIRSFEHLRSEIGEHEPGKTVSVRVLRDGERFTFTVELADRNNLPMDDQ